MAVMARYPDNHFDLACVDPPYFKEAANGGYYGQGTSLSGVIRKNYKHFAFWAIPDHLYFNELLRVSKNQIIWGCNYYAKFIPSAGRIVWDKKNDTSSFSNAELASQSFSKGVFTFRHRWNGMITDGKPVNRIHPTQKPVELYEWILKKYAKEGDRILDTHLGSGSSAIAAHYAGFDFVGMELDEDYYKAACKRFDAETAQLGMAI